MWVQLKAIKRVEDHGVQRTAHPGDWVDVGRQTAEMWLAEGTAMIPSTEMGKVTTGCGVVVKGSGENKLKYPQKEGDDIVYPKSLLWDTRLQLRDELLPLGFHMLDVWEIAIPIHRYDMMACDVGTIKQRKEVEKVVRDLRVLLYDPRMIFVKRCPAGKEVVMRWKEYKEETENRLALLRAVYEVKPLILALPASWVHNADR